jgi:hypothetical protein
MIGGLSLKERLSSRVTARSDQELWSGRSDCARCTTGDGTKLIAVRVLVCIIGLNAKKKRAYELFKANPKSEGR